MTTPSPDPDPPVVFVEQVPVPVPVEVPGPDAFSQLLTGPVTGSAAVGLALPLLVAFISTQWWPPLGRGLALAALSFAAAFAAAAIDRYLVAGEPLDWREIGVSAVSAWFVAQTAHGSLWRRTEVLERLQAVGSLPPPPEPPEVVTSTPPQGTDVASTIRRATMPGRVERRPHRYLLDDRDPPTT